MEKDTLFFLSADLAEELRREFPKIHVFVGPTPEVDAMLAAMADDMTQPGNGLTEALDDGVPEPEVEALLKARKRGQ